MGVTKRRVKKENGNEQGEGKMWVEELNSKGGGGWQLLKMVTNVQIPKIRIPVQTDDSHWLQQQVTTESWTNPNQ